MDILNILNIIPPSLQGWHQTQWVDILVEGYTSVHHTAGSSSWYPKQYPTQSNIPIHCYSSEGPLWRPPAGSSLAFLIKVQDPVEQWVTTRVCSSSHTKPLLDYLWNSSRGLPMHMLTEWDQELKQNLLKDLNQALKPEVVKAVARPPTSLHREKWQESLGECCHKQPNATDDDGHDGRRRHRHHHSHPFCLMRSNN